MSECFILSGYEYKNTLNKLVRYLPAHLTFCFTMKHSSYVLSTLPAAVEIFSYSSSLIMIKFIWKN